MTNQKTKILLVEDDDIVRATFSKELKDNGLDVYLADSGEEGLRIAAKEAPFDLAILDIKMPGISGIEMAPVLSGLNIPWIFLSAYNDEEMVNTAANGGAMGYLVKPVGATEALPTIFSAIKRSQDIRKLVETETRLNGALETSSHVNVAIGILMGQQKIRREEAFELIRSKARTERRKVKDVSKEILDAWKTANMIKDN